MDQEKKLEDSPIKLLFYNIRDTILTDHYIKEEIKDIYNHVPDKISPNYIVIDISYKKMKESMLHRYLSFNVHISFYLKKESLEYFHDLVNRVKFLFLLNSPSIDNYETISCNIKDINGENSKKDNINSITMLIEVVFTEFVD